MMQPTNSAQRRRSFFKFLGFYALALAAILLPLFSFKFLNFQSAERQCQDEQEKLLATLKQMNATVDLLYANGKKFADASKAGEKQDIKDAGDSLITKLNTLKEQLSEGVPIFREAGHPFDVAKDYHELLLDVGNGNGDDSGSETERELAKLQRKINGWRNSIENCVAILETMHFNHPNKKNGDEKEKAIVDKQAANIRDVLNSMNY